MPKIKPEDDAVQELKGLHLYHAGWSNCSMRVRMTLEEKKLPWISHHLDTRAGEHVTPEFFSINPNGLVPVLVHDGDVWIESVDIIRYLDDTYPEPRLTPTDSRQLSKFEGWVKLAAAIHVSAVKTYVYSSRSNDKHRKSATALARYRNLQSNTELLAFHAKCSSEQGFSAADRAHAEDLLHDAFAKLDSCLGKQRWLTGENFSLADIVWAPLHFTLEQAGFSSSAYTNVTAWAQAIATRPGFQEAVVDWFDGPPHTKSRTMGRPHEPV